MSFVIAYVTYPDRQTAEQIVSSLLEQRIIACANFFPITSVYWWKGKIENSEETVSLLKTKNENWKLLQWEIQKLHPYETPCVIKMEVEANEDYEKWIQEETKTNL